MNIPAPSKLNPTGLGVCGLYAALCLLCLGISRCPNLDPHSYWIAVHLPVLLQDALLSALGIGNLSYTLGWAGYAVLLLVGTLFAYAIGAAIAAVLRVLACLANGRR